MSCKSIVLFVIFFTLQLHLTQCRIPKRNRSSDSTSDSESMLSSESDDSRGPPSGNRRGGPPRAGGRRGKPIGMQEPIIFTMADDNGQQEPTLPSNSEASNSGSNSDSGESNSGSNSDSEESNSGSNSDSE
ncbi:Uncharacterised protein g1920 [Pycnogonum litorale]